MKLKFNVIGLLIALAVFASCRDTDVRPSADLNLQDKEVEKIIEGTPIFEGDPNGNILTFDLDVAIDEEDELRLMAYDQGDYIGNSKVKRNNQSYFKVDEVDPNNEYGGEGTNAVHCVLRRLGENPVSVIKTIKWHGEEVTNDKVRLRLRSVRITLPEGVIAKKGEEWYIVGMIGGKFDEQTGRLSFDGKGYRFQRYYIGSTFAMVNGKEVETKHYQDELDVPHITDWTKLDIKEDYFGKTSLLFKPRGVLMRHQFSSLILGNIVFRQATVTSDAYTNVGYFDPLATNGEEIAGQAGSYPTWVTQQTQVHDTYIFRDALRNGALVQQTEDVFTQHGSKVMGASFARRSPANFMLVWGMPTNKERPSLKVVTQLRESRYGSLTMVDRLTYYRDNMKKLESGKSYRLHNEVTNDLMISRIYYEQSAKGGEKADPEHSYNYSIVQLENTNYDPIDLSRYALIRFDGSDTEGAFVPYAAGRQLAKGDFRNAQVIPLTAIMGNGNPFTGLWANWSGAKGNYSGNWYRKIYGEPKMTLGPNKTLLIGAGGYIKSGKWPHENILLYKDAVNTNKIAPEMFLNLEPNIDLERRAALHKELAPFENQAYPRAGGGPDSAVRFDYCQSMVAIDDGFIKDAMYTDKANSGVLQAGQMIGYALVKALPDGTFIIVDTSVPLGYGDRFTYTQYKDSHDKAYQEYVEYREKMKSRTQPNANHLDIQDWRMYFRFQPAKFTSPKYSDLTGVTATHAVKEGWLWNTSSKTESAGERLGFTYNHMNQLYRTFYPFGPNYMGYNLNQLDDKETYPQNVLKPENGYNPPPKYVWDNKAATNAPDKIPDFSKRIGFNLGPDWTRVKPAVDPSTMNLNPLIVVQ